MDPLGLRPSLRHKDLEAGPRTLSSELPVNCHPLRAKVERHVADLCWGGANMGSTLDCQTKGSSWTNKFLSEALSF